MMFDINPGTNTEKVKEMFAYVSVDEGGEALCAFLNTTGNWMPMVGTTRKNADMMKSLAAEMVRQSKGKKSISLLWFKLESREEI